MKKIKYLFRAFKYRNYRLYFAGQGLSLIGSWMQQVAAGWYVYRITDSPWMLGVVAFSAQIPNLLITPFAGVLADRKNKLKIIIAVQYLGIIQAVLFTVLYYNGIKNIFPIILLSLFLGIINAIDAPARQSFVFDIVDEIDDLPNAIALNSTMFNGARLLGPAIAGFIISRFGEGVCFSVNAVSFIAVIGALYAIRIPPFIKPTAVKNVFHELKEGIKYTYNHELIRNILMMVAFISLLGMPYATLMPVFAKEVLKGSAQSFALLMTASGTGAVAGAIFLASRKNDSRLLNLFGLAGSIFGTGLILVSFSKNLPLAFTIIIMSGFGMMTQLGTGNTIIQTAIESRMRGRVMSLYNMAFMGVFPFGNLLMGFLAKSSVLGITKTLILSGACSMMLSILFLIRLPKYRAKYHILNTKPSIPEQSK